MVRALSTAEGITCAIASPAGPAKSPPTGAAACTSSRYSRACPSRSDAAATAPRKPRPGACSRGCDAARFRRPQAPLRAEVRKQSAPRRREPAIWGDTVAGVYGELREQGEPVAPDQPKPPPLACRDTRSSACSTRTAASPGQRVIEGQPMTVSAASTRPDRRSNNGQTILKDLWPNLELGSEVTSSGVVCEEVAA